MIEQAKNSFEEWTVTGEANKLLKFSSIANTLLHLLKVRKSSTAALSIQNDSSVDIFTIDTINETISGSSVSNSVASEKIVKRKPNATIDGVINEYSHTTTGASILYRKIAELNNPVIVGLNDSGVVLIVTGVSNYGSNTPGSDIVQFSTRGSINLSAKELTYSKARGVTYGYVNNSTTNKVELWEKVNSYTYNQTISVIGEIKGGTVGRWIYVNILDTIFFVFYEYFFSNSIGLKYPNLL